MKKEVWDDDVDGGGGGLGVFLVMLFIPSRFAGFLLHNSCKIRKLSFSDVIDSLTFLYLTCKHFPQVFNHHLLSRSTIKSMKKKHKKNPLNSMPYFFLIWSWDFRNQETNKMVGSSSCSWIKSLRTLQGYRICTKKEKSFIRKQKFITGITKVNKTRRKLSTNHIFHLVERGLTQGTVRLRSHIHISERHSLTRIQMLVTCSQGFRIRLSHLHFQLMGL